jgi:hypothetical protein
LQDRKALDVTGLFLREKVCVLPLTREISSMSPHQFIDVQSPPDFEAAALVLVLTKH